MSVGGQNMVQSANNGYILSQRLARVLREEKRGSVGYQIGSALIDQLPTLHDASIGDVARTCSVSKSTLSKFVRELGYDDYASFKEGAAAYWERDTYYIPSGMNITDYLCGNGVGAYLELLGRDLRSLVAQTDHRALSRAIELLHSATQIGAFGTLYGHTAALNLYAKLSFYRRFVYVTENDEKICQFLMAADDRTAVVLYSNSGLMLEGYGRPEHMPLREAFARTEARIVLVSSNPRALVDPRVDTCLLLPTNESVRNHPFLYQMVNELIGAAYQQRYGFPEGMDEFA